MQPIIVSMNQKIDRASIIAQERLILKKIESYGLLDTKEGADILTRLRQIQMTIEQQLKQRITFQKRRPTEIDSSVVELQEQVQIAKNDYKKAYDDLGKKQQELKCQMGKILQQKLQTLYAKMKQSAVFDLRDAMIDNQSLEEYLQKVFMEQLQQNKESVTARANDLRYIKMQYQKRLGLQKQLSNKLIELQGIQSQVLHAKQLL